MPLQIPLSGSIGVPGSVPLLGYNDVTMTNLDVTLTAEQAAVQFINIIGAAAELNLIFPANPGQTWLVANNTTSGNNIICGTPALNTLVGIAVGQTVQVFVDSNGDLQEVSPTAGAVDVEDIGGDSLVINNDGPSDGTHPTTQLDFEGQDGSNISIGYDATGQDTSILKFDAGTGTPGIVKLAPGFPGLNIVNSFGITFQTDDNNTHQLAVTFEDEPAGFVVEAGSESTSADGTGDLTLTVDNAATPDAAIHISLDGNSTIRYTFDEISQATPTLTSGTPVQNNTSQNMEVCFVVGVLASTGFAVEVARGASSGTQFAIMSESDTSTSAQAIARPFSFIVPPGWWFTVTVTNATINGATTILF